MAAGGGIGAWGSGCAGASEGVRARCGSGFSRCSWCCRLTRASAAALPGGIGAWGSGSARRFRVASRPGAARGGASKGLRRCRRMDAKHANGAGAAALAVLTRVCRVVFCREPACRFPSHSRVQRPSACICVKPFLLCCPDSQSRHGAARRGTTADWRVDPPRRRRRRAPPKQHLVCSARRARE